VNVNRVHESYYLGGFAGCRYRRTVTADNFFVSIRGEAHGTGGSVEGLKLDSQSAFGLTSPPVSTGRIIQPAGKE
jgi:hypothetical protein